MNISDLISAFKNRLDRMAEQQLKPVEIAVIDSGIDSTHPDLAKRIIEAYRVEIQDDKPVVIDVPLGENNDIFGHGTAVASIIARIAPNANIVDIRVLG
ncbi:MAG: S8 family serine peptidase, partial [Deltaproteobacteria bacterium]